MSTPPLRPLQRTAAYAVVRDSGSVLLARASAASDQPGRWFLPGGDVRHGEHPRDAVLRELQAVGLAGVRPRPVRADSDLLDLPRRGVRAHTLRLIYDVSVRRLSPPRVEPDGALDLIRFVPTADLPGLPLMPFVADLFGLPADDLTNVTGAAPAGPADPLPPDRPTVPLELVAPGGDGAAPEVAHVVQRPAAYVALIAQGRILLTHVTGSHGVWTLPGGGIDFGEPPVIGLVREVYEETGLPLQPGPLLDVFSRHFTGRAPSGRLEDFHGISIIYDGAVPVDVEPRVTEVDGSTDEVRWVPLDRLHEIHAVSTVHEAIRRRGQRLGPA